MKQVIKNYTFNATSKTVTLTDFSTVLLERVQLIVDSTTNKILYNFADSTVSTATVATNVITLASVPAGSVSADKLQVIYDCATGDPTYDTPSLPNNAAKETGGNLATLVTNTNPFVAAGAGGYIRQDSTATMAKESGGNLATLAGAVSSAKFQNNLAQVGGSAIALGNTTMSASLPVTLASDDTNTKPFVTSGAGGYIRQDSTATIAKESGGNLATVATNTTGLNSAVGTAGSAVPSKGLLHQGSDGTNAQNIATDTSGNQKVIGSIASGSADSGNPVKVGGVYNSAAQTPSPGQRYDLQLDSAARLLVASQIMNGTTAAAWSANNADGSGTSATANKLVVLNENLIYNGTSFDRQRANQDNISLISSAAYTTTQTGTDQTNYNAKGVIVTVSVTAGSTGSLTPEIDMKDPVSGSYISLLTASTAITGTGTYVYILYPGATQTAGTNNGATQQSSFPLPRSWRVKVTANNANSMTYAVSASVIL